MKKLAIIAAAALLAASTVTASAETVASAQINTPLASFAVLYPAVSTDGGTSTNIMTRQDLSFTIATLDLFDEAFGKYLSDDLKQPVAETIQSLKDIYNSSTEEQLTEDEKNAVAPALVGVVFAYASAIDGKPLDQLINDVLTVAQKDYDNAEDCDAKEYLGLKLDEAKNYDTSISDEEKEVIFSNLAAADTFLRCDKPFTKCDINTDGQITMNDAISALKISVGAVSAEDYEKFLADSNGDGQVSVADAVDIQKKALHVI